MSLGLARAAGEGAPARAGRGETKPAARKGEAAKQVEPRQGKGAAAEKPGTTAAPAKDAAEAGKAEAAKPCEPVKPCPID